MDQEYQRPIKASNLSNKMSNGPICGDIKEKKELKETKRRTIICGFVKF